ncbi:unnamed protein product [Orchesella dallaii]|uniref:Uncharacterized protein n=1 Tax=Orchesella dallaii TaxID=48710 RepID=A0ABP1RE69_9HEXA
MKPFFGISNRISSIIISFIIFGYGVYIAFTEGVLNSEQFRFTRLNDVSSDTITQNGRSIKVKYNFETTSAAFFGLYAVEVALLKVSITFLLFILLLVGASQRSKILLRIWMMVHALVIILGFLVTLMSLTDGSPTTTLAKFLLIICCSLWFFSVVLSLAEEIHLEEEGITEANRVRSCTYVAKSGQEIGEKNPPYYDC